jgi:phosphatidylinositol alpha 1,6-mannosyltransferase
LPRVAFCTDTYDEINGVATISRQFVEFADRHRVPLLVVRPGPIRQRRQQGTVTFVDIPKSSLCLPLDMGLRFDLLIARHYSWLRGQIEDFNPDVLHVTGPGDIGMLCSALAHFIRPKVPLAAAWHTNIHQYTGMRVAPLLKWFPCRIKAAIQSGIESASFRATVCFYDMARLLMAPNQEILTRLTKATGKPGRLMPHGVDTYLFQPSNVDPDLQRKVTLGYVGRLTPEKNVRFLMELARLVPEQVRQRLRFLVVGDGCERAWLEAHLPNAEFRGILRNQDLAEAFAAMDLFIFPSKSDTFGLVVLEAMAAGIPVVAFRLSGPMCAVENGSSGITAPCAKTFAAAVSTLVQNGERRREMGHLARQAALQFSWDCVFESIYAAYATMERRKNYQSTTEPSSSSRRTR